MPEPGKIYAEIGQRSPFARREREALVTLLRTADVVHHALERALAPQGISPEQYNVLRILRGAGRQGHPTQAIAARMISRSPNITRLIDKLVASGLARRERGTSDRRQALVCLTPEGRRRLASLDETVEEVLERLDWSEGDSRTLIRLLDGLRARVARPTVLERARRARDEASRFGR